MSTKVAVYTFNYFYGALRDLASGKDLKQLTNSEKLAIISLLAFSYEAFLNRGGQQALRCWQDSLQPKLAPPEKL